MGDEVIARSRRRWTTFVGWAVVGALCGGALGATFTPLILLVLPAIGLAVLLLRRAGSATGLPGLGTGLAVLPLTLAWLNRGGPGPVCRVTRDGEVCTDAGSPWPWLAIGLVLLACGIGAAVLAFRSGRLDG